MRTIIILTILLLITIASSPSPSPSPFTLYGQTYLNQTVITLTKPLNNCTSNQTPSPNKGAIFHQSPIHLYKDTSFIAHFTFLTLTPKPPCLAGQGLAFVITSDPTIDDLYTSNTTSDSFFAVEFDIGLDQNLAETNANYVHIDVGSVRSLESADLMTHGIDLNSDKKINCWIAHKGTETRVWVGYSNTKPRNPVLVSTADLSRNLNAAGRVGFISSNGSTGYQIYTWEFKAYNSFESQNNIHCDICFPGNLTDATTLPQIERMKKRSEKTQFFIALAVCITVLVIVLGVIFKLLWNRETRVESVGNSIPNPLRYSKIKALTCNFHQIYVVGHGSTSTIYGATLPNNGSGSVAIKRIHKVEVDRQTALTFVNTISKLNHKNLVSLKSWCYKKEFILISDYMPFGTLEKHLYDGTCIELSFERRLRILIGVASGLVYMHDELKKPLVHMKVKTSNIFLDSEMEAQLGFVELITRNARVRSHVPPVEAHTRVGKLDSDVYSFGVVILEVITGRRAVEEEGFLLVDWVWDLLQKKILVDGVDSKLAGQYDKGEIERIMKIGMICAHPCAAIRPKMKDALKMLKGEIGPVSLDVPIEKVLPDVLA